MSIVNLAELSFGDFLPYNAAEYGAYPRVPSIKTFFSPNLFARMAKMEQPKTMMPKVSELAPLTR